MTPAVPPLRTSWYLPFQPWLGSHTSNCTAGFVTPTTRQIGRATVPTGFGFAPAGSDCASVMVVSGSASAARSEQLVGCAANAAGAPSAAATAAIVHAFFIYPFSLVGPSISGLQSLERVTEPPVAAGEAGSVVRVAFAAIHSDRGIRAERPRARDTWSGVRGDDRIGRDALLDPFLKRRERIEAVQPGATRAVVHAGGEEQAEEAFDAVLVPHGLRHVV